MAKGKVPAAFEKSKADKGSDKKLMAAPSAGKKKPMPAFLKKGK